MFASALWIFAVLLLVSLAVLRPQRKRHDRRALMLMSVRHGDDVYTSGGIHALVTGVDGGTVRLSCYPDGTRLSASLDAVAQVTGYDEKKQRKKLKQRSRERSRR